MERRLPINGRCNPLGTSLKAVPAIRFPLSDPVLFGFHSFFFLSCFRPQKKSAREKRDLQRPSQKKKSKVETGSFSNGDWFDALFFFFFWRKFQFSMRSLRGVSQELMFFFCFRRVSFWFFFVSRDGKSFSLSATRSGAPNSQRRQRRSLPACRHSLASKN